MNLNQLFRRAGRQLEHRLQRLESFHAPLWTAGHETGDLTEWSYMTPSGDADANISEIAHTGRYGAALNVHNGNGGIRMVVVDVGLTGDKLDPHNLPHEAFYSVWYLFPQPISPHTNVFQWKQAWQTSPGKQTRRLLYWVRADWSGDGWRFHLRTKNDPATGEWVDKSHSLAVSPKPVLLDQWVHLECFYRWSKTGEGRIAGWQDGEPIFDLANLYTEYDWPYVARPRQWTINNYTISDQMDHTVHIDDAAISLTRVGI